MRGRTPLVLVFAAVSCGGASAAGGQGTQDATMLCGALGEQCCSRNGCTAGLTCTPDSGSGVPPLFGGTCVVQTGADAQSDAGIDDDAGFPRRAPVPPLPQDSGNDGANPGPTGIDDDAGFPRRAPVPPLPQDSGTE
jgi:hypothetical protein